MTADALAKVARGIDPAVEKKAVARAEQQRRDVEHRTFKAVAELHLKIAGLTKSGDQKRTLLERFAFPAIGRMPIESIRKSHVRDLLDRIVAGESTRGGKPAAVTANRVQAAISAVFTWQADRDDDFSNPIAGMKRVGGKESARERTLTDDELRAIWKAAEANPHPFGNLVRFLLLTASRRCEASELIWNELVGADWILPAARNKANQELLRPLSEAARAILADQPRVSQYVFPTDATHCLTNFGYYKRHFDKACGVTGWTLHDLRRTARSLMSRAGVPSEHAERCLGHVLGGVEKTYNRHSYETEKRIAFEKLATLIETIVNPQPNVVALRG